jgi:hypothetical protein
MAGKKGKSGRRPDAARGPLVFGPQVPTPQAAVEPIPAWVTDGLAASGRGFVEATWDHYEEWAPDSKALLREGGRVVDALHEYAERLRSDGRVIQGPRGGTALHPLVRVEAQALRSLLLIVKALRLSED